MSATELHCTCPSGDGSLRWPCPKHPPESSGAASRPVAAAPVATIPTWRERLSPRYEECDEREARNAEIADLRAALQQRQAPAQASALMLESANFLESSMFQSMGQEGRAAKLAERLRNVLQTEAAPTAEKCRYCGGDGEHYQGPSRYAECEPCNGTGVKGGQAEAAPVATEEAIPTGRWSKEAEMLESWANIGQAVPVASAELIYQVEIHRENKHWRDIPASEVGEWKQHPVRVVYTAPVAQAAPTPTAKPVAEEVGDRMANTIEVIVPALPEGTAAMLLKLVEEWRAFPPHHPVSIGAGEPSQQEMLEAARLAGMDVVGDCINPERTVGNMTRAVFAFGKRIMDARAAHPSPEGGAAEAIQEVIGCFRAAEIEGLAEALALSDGERLKDLVERRLMYALYAAQAATPSTQQETDNG